MSGCPRLPTIGRRAAVAALVALAAVPAAADAATSAFSDFRLAGGTRFTLTLSKAQQLPGIDPTISPKGYRFVCKVSGPVLRHKVNSWSDSDTAELETYLAYAKPGSLSFARLGRTPHWTLYTTADRRPRTVQAADLLSGLAYATVTPDKQPVAPLLGLYNLQVIPYSSSLLGYLPAAFLSAKLDVRQGTDAECPTPTVLPWEYYRASR